MTYWIFKLAHQEIYSEEPGETYRYDNTHSIKVHSRDVFIYLDKREGGYSFSGTGRVLRVTEHTSTKKDQERDTRVRTVFTAHLTDMIWFRKPLSISSVSKEGRRNRSRLGILNALAWAASISNIGQIMYTNIVGLAQEQELIVATPGDGDFSVPDSWGPAQVRKVGYFSDTVLDRHNHTCAVCGTRFKSVLSAAHLSPYSTDKQNRANPANGICLCSFCHSALDKRQIALRVTGEIVINPEINDSLAIEHFTRINPKTRMSWLSGVGKEFLKLSEKLYSEHMSK